MSRYYRINGKLYPSVTTALTVVRRPYLELWRGDLGNELADAIRDEAGELGRAVHKGCEMTDKGEDFTPPSADVERILLAYQEWAQATVKEWLKVEQVVSCHHYRYAGRLDRVAVLKGDRQPTVIDIKTSGYISKDMGLQLAAYQHCLEDVGIKPKRRIVLHLDKRQPGAPARAIEFPEYERDFRLFLYALELFRFFEGGKEASEIVSA